MKWLTVFLVTPFDIDVDISNVRIVKAVQICELCEERPRIPSIWVKRHSIDAEDNDLY